VDFDGRLRGAGGVQEAGWLDSVVTTEEVKEQSAIELIKMSLIT
jgi:hypothetical protein